MKHDGVQTRVGATLRWVTAAMLAMGVLFPLQALAQPRFYWKTLSDANAVPLIFESMSGNTNPFNPALTVTPGANVSGAVAIAGYAHTFSLFDRAAMGAILLPMGRVSGEVTVFGKSAVSSANGFGDPMAEFDVNVIGPKALTNLADVVRYEPGFSLDVLADVAFPIGKYNSSQPLNLGQNRWYGRVGLPVVWQIGPWVPGERTTLELLPALWWFTGNNDYLGHTLTTDALFALDVHVTRDLTAQFWGSLDAVWYYGGTSSVDGVAGKMLNNFGVGITLGYQITSNLGLTAAYKTTVDDSAPESLRMDSFTVQLVYGWHSLVEGVRRLEGEK